MRTIRGAWSWYGKTVTGLCFILVCLSATAIVVAMLATLHEVVARYFFHAPTQYAYPLVTNMSIFVLYGAIGYTANTGGNVSSDLLFEHLGPRGRGVILIVSDLCALLLGFLIARESWQQVDRSLALGAKIPDLNVPLAVPQMMVVVGSVMLMLVAIGNLPTGVQQVLSGEDKKEVRLEDTLGAEAGM